MSAVVWPMFVGECDEPGCGWQTPAHLSPMAAQDEVDRHNEDHAVARAVEAEVLAEYAEGQP